MSTLIEAVTLTVSTLALASGAATWHFRNREMGARRRSERLHRHTENLTQQTRAIELVLAHVTATVVPTLAKTTAAGETDDHVMLEMPAKLAGTVAADRVLDLVTALAQAIRQVQRDTEAASATQIAQSRQEIAHAAVRARQTSEEATQAAVRSVASSLVATASRVSKQISEGVRRHASEEAYETLVTIDHLGQQLLLSAQSYVVLGGGKLSRRWPAASLTDIVRAAMGHLDGFERIKYEESDVAVTSRAVGPVIHTLAVLLDNALRYSPKSAVVEVRLRHGHHGVTVTIDDAGLQMSPEQLLSARRILAGERLEDVTRLGAHPQTGFRVAAILAREYRFRVEVEAPNPYQGSRALIFLPNALLGSRSAVPTTSHAMPEVPADPVMTTPNGLAVRQRIAPTRPTPSDEGSQAQPGRASVVAAWADGTRRARPHPTPSEGL